MGINGNGQVLGSVLAEAMESAQQLRPKVGGSTYVPDGWDDIARRRLPEPRVRVTMQVDADVAAFFRRMGRGHQGRMNDVLRAFMLAWQGGWLPVAGMEPPKEGKG